MLLSIDVGNTNTNVGLYDEELVRDWILATNKQATVDELYAAFEGLTNIDAISLSCVVPELLDAYKKFAQKKNIDLYILSHKTAPKKYFANKYPYPEEIGADFIAATIGGRRLVGSPCVVVDLGTATDFCIIDAKGYFRGGIIVPGVETSLYALIGKASALNDTELKAPENVIGYSTDEAIRSGLILGEAARIDGLVARIEEELNQKVSVVTTGGWSELISQYMKCNPRNEHTLILDALKLCYDEARSN